MKNSFVAASLLICTLLTSCFILSHAQQQTMSTTEAKGLKDYYAPYFPIGVAVSPRALKTDEGKLILQQFPVLDRKSVV